MVDYIADYLENIRDRRVFPEVDKIIALDDQWSVIMIKIMQVIIWVINMIMVKIHKITSIEERLFIEFPPIASCLQCIAAA